MKQEASAARTLMERFNAEAQKYTSWVYYIVEYLFLALWYYTMKINRFSREKRILY